MFSPANTASGVVCGPGGQTQLNKKRICKNCNKHGHYTKTCSEVTNRAQHAPSDGLSEVPVNEAKSDSSVDYGNSYEIDEQMPNYYATTKVLRQALGIEHIRDCKAAGKFEFVINLTDIIEVFEDFNTDNVDCFRLDLTHIRRLYKLYKNKMNEINKNRYTVDYTRSFKTMQEAIEYRDKFFNSLKNCIRPGYIVPYSDKEFFEDFFRARSVDNDTGTGAIKDELRRILRNGAAEIRNISDEIFTFSYVRSLEFGSIQDITACGTRVDYLFLDNHYKNDYHRNRDRSPFSYHQYGAPQFDPTVMELPHFQIPSDFTTERYESIAVHYFARLKNNNGPVGFVVWTWRRRHDMNYTGGENLEENTERNVRRRVDFVDIYRETEGVEQYVHFVYYMHRLRSQQPESSTWFQYQSADPKDSNWDYLCG